MNVLCIDVGGSSLKYAVIDQDYSLSHEGRVVNTFRTREQFLKAVKNLYQELASEVSGIAVSYCGELNPDTGEVLSPGSYRYFADSNLKQLLEDATGTTVWVEKDAVCAGLAEANLGSLRGYRNSVALTLGTALGCVILRDGEPYYGSHDMASLVWVSSTVKGTILRKMATDAVIKTWNGSVRRQENPEGIDGRAFFRRVEKGSPAANLRLHQFTGAIARFVADTQILLDVDAFAIGGGVSAQPRLIEAIQKRVDKIWNGTFMKMAGVKKPEIIPCEFKNDANLIGAMYNYIHRETA